MNSVCRFWTYIAIFPQKKHHNVEHNNDKVIIERPPGVESELTKVVIIFNLPHNNLEQRRVALPTHLLAIGGNPFRTSKNTEDRIIPYLYC